MNPLTEIAAPMTDSSNDYRVKPYPPCVGCGGPDHGSVGEGIRCLKATIRALRDTIESLRLQAEPREQLRTEVAKLRAKWPHWSDR